MNTDPTPWLEIFLGTLGGQLIWVAILFWQKERLLRFIFNDDKKR